MICMLCSNSGDFGGRKGGRRHKWVGRVEADLRRLLRHQVGVGRSRVDWVEATDHLFRD